MKRNLQSIAIALLLCATATVTVSAKVKSKVISFGRDFSVGGTVVKSGTYRVSFDDQTNELTITDRKTKSVLAKAAAHAAERQSGANGLDIQMVASGDTQVFSSIAFPGDKQIITVGDAGSAAK
jgi:hypothetical protein